MTSTRGQTGSCKYGLVGSSFFSDINTRKLSNLYLVRHEWNIVMYGRLILKKLQLSFECVGSYCRSRPLFCHVQK